MGEAQGTLFEPQFNRSVKVETAQQRISSHAGAVLLRELDHKLGLTESLAGQLADPRDPQKVRYTATELLRERVYSLAMGEANQDDADRLAHDPAVRMATWDRPGEDVLEERLASQPTQSRLIGWLGDCSQNREALRQALFGWTDRYLRSARRGRGRAVRRGTVDVDSFPVTIHGQQQGGHYNGYHRRTVYYPQVASFAVEGNYDSGLHGHRLGNGFIHATLRQGQVHTAQGAQRFIQRVIEHARQLAHSFDLRLDAGFTIGEVLDDITDRGVRFCGRLKKNPVLDRLAEPHLQRPPGRPPRDGYETVVELGKHRAESWKHAQRLILVVVDRPDPKTGQLNLLPKYFFLVTNWPRTLRSGEEVLAHYRRRGTFEDRLGEFNEAIGPHLSSLRFVDNEVTLLLALLAFNLATMLRGELEDDLGGCWDLRRFQQTVLRAGGRVVKHSRRLWLHIEHGVSRFWSIVATRIAELRLPQRWHSPQGARPRHWVPPPSHAHLAYVPRD